jgi:hypothetical protein
METIDSYFRYCAEISKDVCRTDYNEHVVHIKNVFKDPYRMLKFQSLLTKWESCHNAKPGIMSLKIPYWTAEIIANNLLDLPDHDDFLNECEFYYFYRNNIGMDNSGLTDLRSNNCLLPHTDPGKREQVNIIGLINLNNRNVSTGFWEYDGCLIEDSEELADEYSAYASEITHDTYEEKINNGILDKVFEVSYGFNEAILYDSRCFHQPIIDSYWTRENPRIMMRLSYVLDEDDEDCYDD